MHIVFIYSDNELPQVNSTGWRGKMFYSAVQKTGLHQVVLVKYSELHINNKVAISHCMSAQIIVIEGSIHFDMLTLVNYWKSRGKKVVVDIPATHEFSCSECFPTVENPFSIAHIYSGIHYQKLSQVDHTERFRWGLHLADCILVSSLQSQSHWQSTAPIKQIRDYFDLEVIQDIVKIQHDELVIGLFYNSTPISEDLQMLLQTISADFPNVKWLPLGQPQLLFGINPDSILNKMPLGLSSPWPGPLSIIDLAIFWDTQVTRGEFSTTILEVMAKKIPWILNDGKGYKEFEKYGLIIQDCFSCQQKIQKKISDVLLNLADEENGYLFSIGNNIEDHIHEIIGAFSDILKSTG